MDRPAMSVTSVSISAPDPRALADFYRRLLGWSVSASESAREGHPQQDGWAQLRPRPSDTGPTLNFEYEPAHQHPRWPAIDGAQQTQLHLDIAVSDVAEAVQWAVKQGATCAEFQPQEDVRVMMDPAGHPFCLFLSG